MLTKLRAFVAATILCLRQARVVAAGGVIAVVAGMNAHPNSAEVIQSGIRTLRRIAAVSDDERVCVVCVVVCVSRV